MRPFADPARAALYDHIIILYRNGSAPIFTANRQRGDNHLAVTFWQGFDGAPAPTNRRGIKHVWHSAGRACSKIKHTIKQVKR